MRDITLLCLPYAGASATIYYKLKSYLKGNINLIPIELPGRGARMDERLSHSFEEVLEDVVNQIDNKTRTRDKYMLLGYSFGSLLAYEASKILRKKPDHLFLAAFQPPMYEVSSDVLDLEDREFLQELSDRGGIDADLDKDFEILKYFLPVMRADFASIANYKYNDSKEKLQCDATILYTLEDEYSEEIHKWNSIFTKPCEYKEFSGDHFFIKREYAKIANVINDVSLRYI